MSQKLECQVGARAAVNGRKGRVVATSGTDRTCIVAYAHEDPTRVETSGWLATDKVQILPDEEEK
jgi:hypothetical protein